MKPRIRTSLLVMFVGVTLAAVAQEHCPPLTFLRLKPPLLLGVAAYYAMRREAGYAVAAAAWCGLMEDALGFVPCGVSPLAIGACLAAARLVVRPQVPEGAAACALVGGAAAPIVAFAQYFAMRLCGAPGVPLFFLAARLLALTPLGAAAAWLCAAGLRGLDWLSVNVEPEEDDDESLDWCA